MTKGVYIRTEEHLEIVRQNMNKAREVARRLPITQKQIEARRKNARKMGLSTKDKPNPHKGNIFKDDIVCHHNDLCHGTKDPNNVTYMIMSEHMSLHNKLRINNGTHNLLAKNKR